MSKILVVAVAFMTLTVAGCASRNNRDGMDGLGVAMGVQMVQEQRR